jgi:sodium/potassium-transporting ATPase subunit alpha
MSSLTGEARPVAMQVDPADRESVIDAKNIAFSSTLVLDGHGIGIVIKYACMFYTPDYQIPDGHRTVVLVLDSRVADDTFIGTIAGLASRPVDRRTTMYLEVQRFVKFIGVMAVCMAIILAIVAFARGQRWQDVLIFAFVSIIVANVPQGLPATVTSMLSLACSSLSKRNVYVKRADVIESLGSASVICTDKTGTLTMNLMR